MSLPDLIDQYVAALGAAGVTQHTAKWSQREPATDADLDALSKEIERPIPPDLDAWLRHVRCALPLSGNYTAVAASEILSSIQSTRRIDFSKHHANITSWKDGRFADGRIKNTYWAPQWVPIARDSCGNEYCVDLAPGPNGAVGQLLAMEFQDGQGPYLAPWPTLEAMVRAHLEMLVKGKHTIDEEGFIEFDC